MTNGFPTKVIITGRAKKPMPITRTELRLAINHCRIMGVWDAFKHGLGNLLIEPNDERFDRKHGTDTGPVLYMRSDEEPKPGAQVLTIPSHPKVVRHILHSTPIQHAVFTFVDFGCGKGRSMLNASEFPFKHIVGVEWSEALVRVAQRNISVFNTPDQQCTNLEVRRMNVLDFDFPPGDVLVYMYNPFGVELTERVFEKIRQDRRGLPSRTLVAFCGLGRREDDFISGCYRNNGFSVLHKERTLAGWSSWMLGELPG